MTNVDRMPADLAEYTTSDLEALERDHPEWGRLEVIDGALHATGGSAVGDLHQLKVQKLHLVFAAADSNSPKTLFRTSEPKSSGYRAAV